MAHTTLASTDRALEKIGDFVAAQDYLSLAERLAAAPGMLSDYLVRALENDFPHLIERQRCTFCRGLYQGDGYTHAGLSAKLCQSCAAAVVARTPAEAIADDSATVFTTP